MIDATRRRGGAVTQVMETSSTRFGNHHPHNPQLIWTWNGRSELCSYVILFDPNVASDSKYIFVKLRWRCRPLLRQGNMFSASDGIASAHPRSPQWWWTSWCSSWCCSWFMFTSHVSLILFMVYFMVLLIIVAMHYLCWYWCCWCFYVGELSLYLLLPRSGLFAAIYWSCKPQQFIITQIVGSKVKTLLPSAFPVNDCNALSRAMTRHYQTM